MSFLACHYNRKVNTNAMEPSVTWRPSNVVVVNHIAVHMTLMLDYKKNDIVKVTRQKYKSALRSVIFKSY